jgi:hypothetical protein
MTTIDDDTSVRTSRVSSSGSAGVVELERAVLIKKRLIIKTQLN